MKLSQSITLEELAKFLKCEYKGAASHEVSGLNEIHMVENGDLVFVDHPKYYKKALESAATTILINKDVDCPEGKGLLISDSPFDDFNKLTRKYRPFETLNSNVSPSPSASIGEGTYLAPNAVIGNHVKIGKNCVIHPGVSISDYCEIGDDVIIQSNTVIGGNAFYYKRKETGYDRLHTCGRVIIKDKAEIGALCTIDAGVTGDTEIGEGTMIDNQVHIGHDTIIGANCLFAAHVGIAGCVTIKDNVTLWGQVGVISDVVIGEGAVVYGQSGIGNDLDPNRRYLGSPAIDARIKWRQFAAIQKLPEILENLS